MCTSEATGIMATSSDLQQCSQVLRQLVRMSSTELKAKKFRDLRKAAVSFVRSACPEAFKGVSGPRKAETRKRKRERDEQVKSLCQLRASRIARLSLLEGDRAPCVPDGPAQTLPALRTTAEGNADTEGCAFPETLFECAHKCYVCKMRFSSAHHFYADLCPACAELNYAKRTVATDMVGRVCLVTGARVKVGFHTCLKLLRMGAKVIATTRFPTDAWKRYQAEPDSKQWLSRLEVVALDFRFVGAVEEFCKWLLEKEDFLDLVIHNAAQTIRRPAAYYKHLVEAESFQTLQKALCFTPDRALLSAQKSAVQCTDTTFVRPPCFLQTMPHEAALTSAEASQLVVTPEDAFEDETNFPTHQFDSQGQQLDLRTSNSWKAKLEDVSCAETLEVLLINVVAPFLMNGRLLPLLRKSPHTDRYIVNVSAMEGKFNRAKSPCHPHTNMAKAALNMMTRTCAQELARDCIFMTSVDTGWINDENPLPEALKRAARGFQTPLDEIDAASRILDPVIAGICFARKAGSLQRPHHRQGQQPDPSKGPVWGVFLKDYANTDW
eukprot:TRINITY_DN16070_c0_g5_i2.p1 TRINITY_DN16070_c0_g5~~TRINITY_DN16070_c0_g5_i2.p1  ORF type:complete len:552 (-),score=84.02 TRINITY_DN16070_c0_g5_i2:239-1894(-)